MRTSLGGETFAVAWVEGERMSLDEAAIYALALEPPMATRAPEAAPLPTSFCVVARSNIVI